MRAGLVRDDVHVDPAPDEFWQHLGRVAHQPDRDRLAGLASAEREVERLVEVVREAVAVARVHAALDARLVHVDAQERGAVHADA